MTMSGTVSGIGYGELTQVVTGAGAVKRTIDQLTTQTASGFVATDYAGLGQNASAALNLGPQIAAAAQVQANGNSAATYQSTAQTALGQIESIASNFAAQAATLISVSGSTQTIASSARDALSQVATLLDTKVGDVYVFAGQDSANPPVPDPTNINSSAFATAIQAAIAGLATNGQAATSAATLAIASPGGTSPFSATLEAGAAQAQVDLGNGHFVSLAPLANGNSDAVSTGAGTTSTGSYTRDILRGLATIGSLTDAQASDANYVPLVQDTIGSLNGAVTAINGDIGALGDRQDRVTAAQTEATDTSTALTTQLSSLQDTDYTQVATQLSQAQTQLQASYQLIASLASLTLAKYLPT
jgi:flagellar hook-associated protein 3 FlgL